LIGKAVDKPAAGDVLGSIASIPELSVFKGNCPLWTYILAEAAGRRAHCTRSVPGSNVRKWRFDVEP
jgi:hypothetical protein